MGFFSKVRRRIKKLIPKEVRPFAPYIAASFIPGGGGLMGLSKKFGAAGLTKYLSDDEADLKDIARAGIFAAAPEAISQGIGSKGVQSYFGEGSKTLSGLNKVGDFLGASDSGKMPSFAEAKLIGAQGSIDAGIKAAELNEEALDKYNRDLAAQGINDKAGRRAAIRAIYSNTGTWDMDEVDSMLDTYGYRTGGRVGYAMGDFVDTDQIVEDYKSYDPMYNIGKGIGNLAKAGVDNIDKIIEVIIKTSPMLAAPDKLIEILVERYGVDPEVAQRKIINRMSDANEGFGSQGLDGTPDNGYRRNIGIDSGAEDYYGETPAMPENLGDMGGSMDDMSGSMDRRRNRRGLDDLIEQMPNIPSVPMPRPDMPRRPDGGEFMPIPIPRGEYRPGDPEFEMPRNYELLNSGGRVGYKKGGFSDEEYSNFMESFESAGEGLDRLKELDEEEEFLPIRELRLAAGGEVMDMNMREQIDTPEGDMTIDENIEVASDPAVMDSLNELSLMLYRRPLSDLTDDEYEELQNFASQQSLKPGLIDEYRNYKYQAEEQGQIPMSPTDYFKMDRGAARMGVARGGIMDVNKNMELDIPGMGTEDVDVNSMESIKGQTAGPDWYMDRLQHLEFLGYNYETAGEIAYDTDRYMKVIEMDIAPGPGEGDDDYARGGRVGRAEGGMMAGADSSLMDAYEIYKFDMMEQGLEPMSIEEFRDQAMAEGKMASMEAGQEATLEEIYIELLDSGMNPEDAAIKAREIYNGMSSKGSGIGSMANMDYREFIYDASRDNFANDMFGKDYGDLNEEETEEVDIIIEIELGKNQAAPERTMAASGGLMNLGGREMDLRGGGFVPMGAKERADDVPARLSKNEFVMTADAVRAAGGGSVQKGADLMYDQMKQLEGQA